MSNFRSRRKKTVFKNRKKVRNKRLAVSILVLAVLLGCVLLGQLIINRSNEKKTQATALEAGLPEAKDETKDSPSVDKKANEANANKSDKQQDKLKDDQSKLVYKNTSDEGQKYISSAEEAEKAVKGKAQSDGKKIVYLTFDDGPSTTVTPKVLDILKKEDVKATFFIVGKNLSKDGTNINEKSGEILKRTYNEGHAIANHSYSHNYEYLYPGRTINVNRFLEEVEKTNSLMKSIIGESFESKVVRFPGGLMSWKGQDAALKALKDKGINYVDWNALNGDAEGKKRDAQGLIERAISTSGSQEKVVLLMHDTYGKETTAEALPKVIHHFKSNGYEFRTLN
ncbi:polysaccharide deacetylase [Clostridium sp. MSJ-4]|uniref:Polysaccharide deacetylase n=1 Tax=Clostridium simiarum TaxID=2841506 RepID=A0ABS6F399_9CLOT|nr:polysaccharide deacetylase family protein [Clostridium simiarum]MBU5592954.1 polysaccharide deacetylase [Clostridium simiarum]